MLSPNTVDLGVGGRGSAASVEHVPQPGDPLIEGAQFEAMTLGIGSPFEATVAPRSHMVTPDCVAAGWRGWLGGRGLGRGSGWAATPGLGATMRMWSR